MTIGDKIRQLRNEKGLSTYDLSEKTEISQSTISKLENNKRKADFDIIKKIAEALQVPIGELIEEIDIYSDENKDVEALKRLGPSIIQNLIDMAKDNPDIAKAVEEMGLNNKYLVLSDIIKKIEYSVNEGTINVEFNILDDKTNNPSSIIVNKISDDMENSIIREPSQPYIIKEHNKITDIKQAMDIIMSQPGLMLNGEMLSDESKIALANAIQLGLQYAEQMQKKEKENKD